MTIRKQLTTWALLLAVLSLSGCATFELSKPAPAQQQPISVKLSTEELSGWSDLPMGVYRIPDSQVIISGHQKASGAGILFGVLGLAVTSAVNTAAGARAV